MKTAYHKYLNELLIFMSYGLLKFVKYVLFLQKYFHKVTWVTIHHLNCWVDLLHCHRPLTIFALFCAHIKMRLLKVTYIPVKPGVYLQL